MYDDKKLSPKARNTVASFTAMVQAVSNGVQFLFLVRELDHEARAIICDQLRSLLAAVDDDRPERGFTLMRSVVKDLVPLSNRVAKELYRMQDNSEIYPVAAYHLRQMHEAGKLLEGEKMVKMKVGP